MIATQRRLKPVFKCADSDKEKFKQSRCLLTISVGQESHEDGRFAATMNLINTAFSSCTITLHDSLQRYTIALNQEHGADYFHKDSIAAGDRWLARNERCYKNFQKQPVIIRWDTWLNNPDFAKYSDQIAAMLHSDPIYHAAFDETVDEYLTRYCKRLSDPSAFNRERAHRLCFDYLIEECTVLCLWPKTGCHFELYAGKHNTAIEETRKRFISPIYPDLVRAIMIGFNHRPNLRPQRFDFSQNKNDKISEELIRE